MTEHKSLVGRWVLIGLVVGAAVAAFWSHVSPSRPLGLTLGQDLRGGTTLRFSLDLDAARKLNRIPSGESDADIVKETLRVIETRVNRFGLAEINITPIGDDKFEISIPSEVDAESIKKVVAALGELQFRIEVLPAYSDFQGQNGEVRTRNQVWEGTSAFERTADGFEKFKEAELAVWKKARDAGEPYVPSDPRYRLVPREETARATERDFVVVEEPVDKTMRLGGDILTNIRPGPDGNGGPGVHFDVKVDYQGVFSEWTGKNVGLPMSILLNGEFHSAPIINSPLKDSVVITLGGGALFGPGAAESMKRLVENQKQLVAVLQSGSLKVQPVAEAANTVGPTLAGQAVQRGLLSTLVAFLLVLLYMAIYYFRAGLIANLALLLNLVLLVGAMAFLEGTLTLPGIAGIVLTLGMAVDANILVYERIREEQARGRSVARAVGEGFDRAFTTIVDSNVTTFLTALFLYVFGTGAIKGFAVTLSLGLLASMFTAVYVTRTVFEAWIRRGKVHKIHMLGTGKVPKVRWMKLRRHFIPLSIALMVLSLGLFLSSKEETIYDIEFTGGMKLQARFAKPTTTDDVKKALDAGPQQVSIPDAAAPAGTVLVKKITTGPYADSEVVTVGAGNLQVEMRHRLALSGSSGAALAEREQLDAYRAYVEAVLKDRLLPPWVVKAPTTYKSSGDADVLKEFDGRLRFEFAIEDPKKAVTAAALKAALEKMPYFDYETEGRRRTRLSPDTVQRRIELKDVPRLASEGGDAKVYEVYWKSDRGASSTPAEIIPENLLLDIKEYVGGLDFKSNLVAAGIEKAAADAVVLADPFPVNDLIGAGVARRMRNDAVLALLLSFVAIIIYVAFRFRSYAMGFSAVLCLVHDVVIALGAVCLADQFGIIDAKINLGLVAAFLTLVGYSVNDTVVTFDRIRELRGKAPRISSKMIEDSINQTFSRTIRTAVTVFLTLVVLFVINVGQRSMLEGLSFTLLVGVVIGTYSSVGVAAPMLLFLPWFWSKIRAYRPREWAATWPMKKPYGWALLGAAVLTTVAVTLLKGNIWLGVFWGLLMMPVLVTAGFFLLWALAFGVGALIMGMVMILPWSFRDDVEHLASEAVEAPVDEPREVRAGETTA